MNRNDFLHGVAEGWEKAAPSEQRMAEVKYTRAGDVNYVHLVGPGGISFDVNGTNDLVEAPSSVRYYEVPKRGALCITCWANRQVRKHADVHIDGTDLCVDCVLVHANLRDLRDGRDA